jgi:hypothetical protein
MADSQPTSDILNGLRLLRSSFASGVALAEGGDAPASLALLRVTAHRLASLIEFSAKDAAAQPLNDLLAGWPALERAIGDATTASGAATTRLDPSAVIVLYDRVEPVLVHVERALRARLGVRGWDLGLALERVSNALRRFRIPLIAAAIIVIAIGVGRELSQRRFGLVGEYFADRDFQDFRLRRRDRRIDFNWERGAPAAGFPADNFSVRWAGYLNVKTPGAYSIFAASDDGVRLWIDQNPVIDHWDAHEAFDVARGDLYLTKGTHAIRIDYFELGGEAAMHLCWRREGERDQHVIPAEALLPVRDNR